MKEKKQLLRESGIEPLGIVPWGMHACIFYKTKQDLIDMLVPYFKAGLENSEFCMWITSEPLDKKDAEKEMRKTVPDYDKYSGSGQIEIISYSDWYLKKGGFNGDVVFKGWMDMLNRAHSNGYVGMRVAGNTTWLDESIWGKFIAYEYKINTNIERYDMIVVCAYRLSDCSEAEIIKVVNTHQLALVQKQRQWELVKNAERKKAQVRARAYQEQLKSLALRQALTEEKERRRLSMSLHDTVSQPLVISKLKLDGLCHSVSDKSVKDELDDIRSLLGRTIWDTKSLTYDLSFPILYELGFESAVVTWLDKQIGENYDIETEFEDDKQPKPLLQNISVLLFRSVRELLYNIIRHAQAEKVKVSVNRDDWQIRVCVEDNGVGFDHNDVIVKSSETGSFGLFSIRERLEEIGGYFNAESEPGLGSKITITAPLKREKNNNNAEDSYEDSFS